MPWNQTVKILYAPKDSVNVQIKKLMIPSKIVSFQSNYAIQGEFSHYFSPRAEIRLENPLIDLSSGDVFAWDKDESRWLLVEETSEWPIEYRLQFARIPNSSIRYPRLGGSYVNGILSNSHYHRLTEDVPTILTLGEENPILVRSSDERFLSNFSLQNFQRVRDKGFIQVDYLTFLSKGSDVGYLIPEYRDILRITMQSHLKKQRHRLLYLTRVNARRALPNESEILGLMKEMNFEIIFPERFTLSEQVALFSESKLVVAPHGGALTNLLFADSAIVIEIMPKNRVNRCFEWQSGICGHNYTRILSDKFGLRTSSLRSLLSSWIMN